LNGLITHIQRYSIHDGPGIRTVVFFKGCPLACLWCCNPETQSFQPDLEFIKNLCQLCGKCVQICPERAVNPVLSCPEMDKIDRYKCTLCGKCVQVCPSGALKMVGERMSLEDVLAVIQKDSAFYRRSSGGVTLSGGEPLSQDEFALEILHKCHDLNIHTAVETCGLVKQATFQKVLPYTDLFLFDIKYLDSKRHQDLTGTSNEIIQENLHWLCRQGSKVILRLPLIPSMNMEMAYIHDLLSLIRELGIGEVNLMPFHQMGKDKYSHLGRRYSLTGQSDLRLNDEGREKLLKIQQLLVENKIDVVVGG
jgi:pyruvate formate lyase activating enzyme